MMTPKELARQLEGRTIVSVDLKPFADGRGGKAFDPTLTLDNGAVLTFKVQETESVYGIAPHVSQPGPRAASADDPFKAYACDLYPSPMVYKELSNGQLEFLFVDVPPAFVVARSETQVLLKVRAHNRWSRVGERKNEGTEYSLWTVLDHRRLACEGVWRPRHRGKALVGYLQERMRTKETS